VLYSIAAAAAAAISRRRHNFPLFLNGLPFLFFHAGRKSEAWIRKLRGLHFNEEDYISTTKFTFALEVIHDGVSVAKSAGFELRPDTENGTCTVEIDKLATFHDIRNLGHGRATVFAMVLAAGALAMKLFNLPVTLSTVAVSNSNAKAFYSRIGYQKDRGLEHGGLGGAFLVPVVISDVEEEPEAPTTAATEAPADSARDDREEADAAGSAAPAEAGTEGRSQQDSSKQKRAEKLRERWALTSRTTPRHFINRFGISAGGWRV
jgi:hypothetical protein